MDKTDDDDNEGSSAESVVMVPVLQQENKVATKSKNDKTSSGHKVSLPFILYSHNDASYNNNHLIFFQSKKKKSLISKDLSNRNAKQEEREIFNKYLLNQSAAIKLKSRKFKREMKAEKKAAGQKKCEIIFDVMKKRLELEKMGASKEYLNKYFPITPLAKKDDSSSGEQSDSSSD